MKDVTSWGMLVFLLNEGTLFAALLASYFYIGAASRAWPPAAVAKPELVVPLVMTSILLSSSAVLVYAERGFERGQRRRYRVGTGATVVLGVAFLVMQVLEYRDKLRHLRPSDSAYASFFYAITGLHGTHVAVGLLALCWVLLGEARGTFQPGSPPAMRNTSLYWHFVDGVWLAVLTSLYLSPRWS